MSRSSMATFWRGISAKQRTISNQILPLPLRNVCSLRLWTAIVAADSSTTTVRDHCHGHDLDVCP